MNDANENYQIKTVTIASMAMPFTIQTVSYPNRPYPYEITKQQFNIYKLIWIKLIRIFHLLKTTR